MPHAVAQPGMPIAGGAMGTCAHCGKRRYIQARGLCQRCRKKPEVRALFPKGWVNPATAKLAGLDQLDLVTYWFPLADEPTTALPGSEAKIEVMRERAEAGRAVFHPDDVR